MSKIKVGVPFSVSLTKEQVDAARDVLISTNGPDFAKNIPTDEIIELIGQAMTLFCSGECNLNGFRILKAIALKAPYTGSKEEFKERQDAYYDFLKEIDKFVHESEHKPTEGTQDDLS